MIYFWTPGLNSDNTIAPPPIELPDMEADYNHPLNIPRTYITLPNPDFVDGIDKQEVVIQHRSMNGVLRTYTQWERSGQSAYLQTLVFRGLRTERKEALAHFILSCNGKYVGYKSPDDRYHAGYLLPQAVGIESYGRNSGPGGALEGRSDKYTEDVHHATSITLHLFRHTEAPNV